MHPDRARHRADTPAEIAVAIVAQLIQFKRKGSALNVAVLYLYSRNRRMSNRCAQPQGTNLGRRDKVFFAGKQDQKFMTEALSISSRGPISSMKTDFVRPEAS